MTALTLEHVPLSELPAAWRAKIKARGSSTVKVKIELESSATSNPAPDAAFGIWQDRTDLADPVAHVRKLRAPRHASASRRNDA
jgi:hypothetical protein